MIDIAWFCLRNSGQLNQAAHYSRPIEILCAINCFMKWPRPAVMNKQHLLNMWVVYWDLLFVFLVMLWTRSNLGSWRCIACWYVCTSAQCNMILTGQCMYNEIHYWDIPNSTTFSAMRTGWRYGSSQYSYTILQSLLCPTS